MSTPQIEALDFTPTCDMGHPDGYHAHVPPCHRPAAYTVTYHTCEQSRAVGNGDGTSTLCERHTFAIHLAAEQTIKEAEEQDAWPICGCGHIIRTPEDLIQPHHKLAHK